jgi:hypothetical protein
MQSLFPPFIDCAPDTYEHKPEVLAYTLVTSSVIMQNLPQQRLKKVHKYIFQVLGNNLESLSIWYHLAWWGPWASVYISYRIKRLCLEEYQSCNSSKTRTIKSTFEMKLKRYDFTRSYPSNSVHTMEPALTALVISWFH